MNDWKQIMQLFIQNSLRIGNHEILLEQNSVVKPQPHTCFLNLSTSSDLDSIDRVQPRSKTTCWMVGKIQCSWHHCWSQRLCTESPSIWSPSIISPVTGRPIVWESRLRKRSFHALNIFGISFSNMIHEHFVLCDNQETCCNAWERNVEHKPKPHEVIKTTVFDLEINLAHTFAGQVSETHSFGGPRCLWQALLPFLSFGPPNWVVAFQDLALVHHKVLFRSFWIVLCIFHFLLFFSPGATWKVWTAHSMSSQRILPRLSVVHVANISAHTLCSYSPVKHSTCLGFLVCSDPKPYHFLFVFQRSSGAQMHGQGVLGKFLHFRQMFFGVGSRVSAATHALQDPNKRRSTSGTETKPSIQQRELESSLWLHFLFFLPISSVREATTSFGRFCFVFLVVFHRIPTHAGSGARKDPLRSTGTQEWLPLCSCQHVFSAKTVRDGFGLEARQEPSKKWSFFSLSPWLVADKVSRQWRLQRKSWLYRCLRHKADQWHLVNENWLVGRTIIRRKCITYVTDGGFWQIPAS